MKLFYDLHLHSCLSPCADNECTPANIAGMLSIAGTQIAALTDHDTVGNCRPFLKWCKEFGILGLPGMELTTAEEVHVLCLFPDIEKAEAFEQYVVSISDNVPNVPSQFGEQLLIDENDEIFGIEVRMLNHASGVGIYSVSALCKKYEGIAIPSHIDRAYQSLLVNLGLWDDYMGFNCAERTKFANESAMPKIPYIMNSDAHALETIQDAQNSIEIMELSTKDVIDALRSL